MNSNEVAAMHTIKNYTIPTNHMFPAFELEIHSIKEVLNSICYLAISYAVESLQSLQYDQKSFSLKCQSRFNKGGKGKFKLDFFSDMVFIDEFSDTYKISGNLVDGHFEYLGYKNEIQFFKRRYQLDKTIKEIGNSLKRELWRHFIAKIESEVIIIEKED